MKKRISCFSGIFFLTAAVLFAEPFRVNNVQVIALDASSAVQSVQLGINDALAVRLPDDRLFLQAVSFEIKIPSIVASYRDSVAYAIYKSVTPVPKTGTIDYNGTRLSIATFPGRLSYNIQIPLVEDSPLKSSPYTDVMPAVTGKSEKFVMLRLQPVMKGVPGDLFSAEFTVQVKPLFTDEGLLVLDVVYPEPNLENAAATGQPAPVVPEKYPYSVFIDEKPAVFSDRGILLPSGTHYLSLVSEFYRNEIRTVAVEQAQVSRISIQLQDIAPTLMVSAPENASVFLDETELRATEKPFVISEGEHTVKVSVGGYETVRKIFVQNGKSYTVSVAVSVEVTEE